MWGEGTRISCNGGERKRKRERAAGSPVEADTGACSPGGASQFVLASCEAAQAAAGLVIYHSCEASLAWKPR